MIIINFIQGKATHQREGYPLRPELIESAMYLYRATGDPYMLEIGEDILHSIQYNARTECGYATIRDVTTLTLEDRMVRLQSCFHYTILLTICDDE